MSGNYDMPEILVAMVQEFMRLDQVERNGGNGNALREKIQIAGQTAAYLDGFDGMKRLHDAAENLVGNDNSIGFRLNLMWDGIGGWHS